MTAAQLALYKPHRWNDIGGRLICAWTPGMLAEQYEGNDAR